MARVSNLRLPMPRARRNAQIRVYCDNDARFVLKPDRPNDIPNAQRTLQTQEWNDTSNKLSHFGPTCKANSDLAFATSPIFARTYGISYAEAGEDLENRVAITVIAQDPSPRAHLITVCRYVMQS